jgi:hypothetical protein
VHLPCNLIAMHGIASFSSDMRARISAVNYIAACVYVVDDVVFQVYFPFIRPLFLCGASYLYSHLLPFASIRVLCVCLNQIPHYQFLVVKSEYFVCVSLLHWTVNFKCFFEGERHNFV